MFSVFQYHIDTTVFAESVPKGDGVWVNDSGVQTYLSFDKFEFYFRGDVGEVYLGDGSVTILMAYSLPVALCTASLTTPKEPLPSRFSSILNYLMDLNSPFEMIFMIIEIIQIEGKNV